MLFYNGLVIKLMPGVNFFKTVQNLHGEFAYFG